MSVVTNTVEFERSPSQGALLSEDESPPFTVSGVALGEGDVTVGQSGVKKLWPPEELEKAAETLQGKNLVEDHDNGSRGVIGQVTKAGYKENVGVIYEAELFDEDLAGKIDNGLLEVSIRGHHIDVEEMEEDPDTGAKIVEGIEFDNLSIVPSGASPSNSIEMGDHEELSMAELSEFVDTLETSELQEIEPGMWVKSDDTRGITVSQVQDGEIEVDIYEKSDGKWRSTGETEMFDVGSLTEWDVDEEEDIGAADDEEEDDSEDGDEEEAQDIPDKFFFDSEDEAMDFIEDKDGLTGVHEMDGQWMPGDTHEEFTEWWDNQASSSKHKDEEEMASLEWVASETLDMLNEFISNIGHADSEVSEFESWADSDAVSRAVEESDVSGGDEVNALREWAEKITQQEEDTEEARSEGQEETASDDKQEIIEQSPERYPDEKTAEEEELQEAEVHSPDFSGTTESDWSKPAMEDFDTDDLSEIDDHFLVSRNGFPPENYGDLALPVVEPNGNLNLSALQNAKARAGQVQGVSDEDIDRAVSIINSLANEEFDADFEEAAPMRRQKEQRPRTVDDTGDERGVRDTGPVGVSLDIIDKYLRSPGHHERDSVDAMLSWLLGNNDIPMDTVADIRVASSTFLSQTAGADSFGSLKLEQFRDWLLTQGEQQDSRRDKRRGDELPPLATPVHVLTGDDLRQRRKSEESEQDSETTHRVTMTEIDELEQKVAELNEPVALEKSELEELEDKANRFGEMADTLEELRERTEVLDEVDRDKVDELSESEDPVVVESSRYGELQDEVEQVKNTYASSLAEEIDIFDEEELAENFKIEELREKYTEHIGEPEEELASGEEAEPRSGDPDEEELEQKAEEEEEEEEELSEDEEKAEEKRAELREKILGGD